MVEPMCKAILLAKYMAHDQESHMWSVCGIYCRILVRQLPKIQPAILVYMKICDVPVGQHLLSVAIADPDGEIIALVDDTGTITSTSSLGEFGTTIGFPEVEFKKFGRHEVQALCDGKIIGTTKLEIIELKAEEE